MMTDGYQAGSFVLKGGPGGGGSVLSHSAVEQAGVRRGWWVVVEGQVKIGKGTYKEKNTKYYPHKLAQARVE